MIIIIIIVIITIIPTTTTHIPCAPHTTFKETPQKYSWLSCPPTLHRPQRFREKPADNSAYLQGSILSGHKAPVRRLCFLLWSLVAAHMSTGIKNTMSTGINNTASIGNNNARSITSIWTSLMFLCCFFCLEFSALCNWTHSVNRCIWNHPEDPPV